MSLIMVAVGGSEHSDKIAEYSCKLVKKLTSSIAMILFSTYPSLVSEYIEIAPSPTRAVQHVQRPKDVTSRLAQKMEAEDIPYEVLLETGDTSETILRKAVEKNGDIVVVGMIGFRCLGRIRSLGGVARRAIRKSPRPAIVPTGAGF